MTDAAVRSGCCLSHSHTSPQTVANGSGRVRQVCGVGSFGVRWYLRLGEAAGGWGVAASGFRPQAAKLKVTSDWTAAAVSDAGEVVWAMASGQRASCKAVTCCNRLTGSRA